MRVFFVCLLKNGSASASSTSGFMDQYFGGEFDVLYPFILIFLTVGLLNKYKYLHLPDYIFIPYDFFLSQKLSNRYFIS